MSDQNQLKLAEKQSVIITGSIAMIIALSTLVADIVFNFSLDRYIISFMMIGLAITLFFTNQIASKIKERQIAKRN